ncbi:DNA replication complex GINS protein SLD5 [Cylas formicarius]|uniref:DNA replication complex GINS protein SLD5 n=1 Tax=Cylas formicarius TaxID=197179 RepID=UPI002958A018|nr:DNA replication complex GINS protein SLD5 [Cylas formicarius]XP_060519090.1 DNA replication complex GINS protein SLD5 [Cylas formicarius]XP_060519091.1 DNA replication complex GINS protein SLD5 [Cylas formicarius]
MEEIEDFEFEEDEERENLTAGELIQRMEEAWLNEKFAPEILPNKDQEVDCLLGQISYMEKNLESLPSTDFRKAIHQMEVDRLQFLVTSYLRMRLEKIELYVSHILHQEHLRRDRGEDLYLTNSELTFAQEYEENLKQYFESIMSFCPGLPTELQVIAPNVHSMVFLKSNKEVEGVVIDDGNGEDGDLIDLNNDSKVLISYNSVSNLVKSGEVHLI